VHHDVAHGDEVDGDIDGDEKSLQIADLHLREDHIDCAEDERGEGRGRTKHKGDQIDQQIHTTNEGNRSKDRQRQVSE
jgi:hypothetical protein